MSGGFDVEGFRRGLDLILASGRGPADAGPYLERALADTAGEPLALLAVLNDAMGCYRALGRHGEAVAAASKARALVDLLDDPGGEARAATLINVATALRAAGRSEEAREAYAAALDAASHAFGPQDRRLAALRNNLSMLYSDAGDHASAARELEAALEILETDSPDPEGDLDVASTLANLALEHLALDRDADAGALLTRAAAVLARGGHERNPHAAAVLAAQGQACLRAGRAEDAVTAYGSALAMVEAAYGTGSEAYQVTAANLRDAQAAAGSGPALASSPAPSPLADMSGLDLARAYWEEHGRPLVERYPELRGRVAAGLVGHGSDCYGFDDAASRDHDWGPGFCLWLTADDHAVWGARLQADYEALPREFRGFPARVETPRGGGRMGVHEIGEFYAGITGHPSAPSTAHAWLALDEPTLAAATNGAVFADPLGAFSAVRGFFLRMPEDVRLALISRRLGMAAQAGQYNVPRMLDRGEGEAAWLAVGEFVGAAASLVFLLNRPTAAGYLPYYKWRFAALRRLRDRPASRLPQVVGGLEEAVRLASAACTGGADQGAAARDGLAAAIESVCALVAAELRAQGLSTLEDPFLEHHRGQIARRITDPWLASL